MYKRQVLDGVDVLINVGDGDTAHTGGAIWEDADVTAAIRGFVHRGGGFIGVGEPSGHQYQGHYFQLAGVLGVEKETGFTLNYDCLLYTSSGRFHLCHDRRSGRAGLLQQGPAV